MMVIRVMRSRVNIRITRVISVMRRIIRAPK